MALINGNVMQKKDKLVKALVNAFGPSSVRVNTEHHVQVRSSNSGWHDVWINKESMISMKICGKRSVKTNLSANDVIGRIENYNTTKTDLAAMHEALRIGESIQHAHAVMLDRQLDRAIFVDAGFKDGKAKAAAILVTKEGDVDVRVRSISINTSSQAEYRAVLLGMDLRDQYADYDTPIFTDCKALFEHKELKNVENINWIPRIRNKGADRLSNMRKRSRTKQI